MSENVRVGISYVKPLSHIDLDLVDLGIDLLDSRNFYSM